MVAGIYQAANTYSAFYVRALDGSGDILWEKILDEGFGYRNLSGGGSFIPTKDGNFILAASKKNPNNSVSESEIQTVVLTKINENGDVLWKKMLHQNDIQSVRQISQANDGSFIIVGFQKLEDEKVHTYIAKLNERGDMEWDKQLRIGNKSVALSVETTVNNDYIVSGYQINDQTATDMFVSKLNSDGELIWTKSYGTDEHDTGCTVKALPNGDFLMAGAIREQGIKKLYLAQLNNQGEIQWDKIHALPHIANIQTSLQLTENGDFAGVAYFYNENEKTMPIVLFFDKNGFLIHQQIIEGQSQSNTYIKDMEPTADGGYVLTGFNYNEQNSWVLKTDNKGYACEELNCQRSNNDLQTDIADNFPIKTKHFVQIAPNPISSESSMTYQLPLNQQYGKVLIYNQSGRLVQQFSIHQKQGSKTIAAKDFESGMYVYQVIVKEEVLQTGRFSVR